MPAVVVLGGVAIGLLDDPDPLHLGLAALFSALALWTAVLAALMVYLAVAGRGDRPKELERP